MSCRSDGTVIRPPDPYWWNRKNVCIRWGCGGRRVTTGLFQCQACVKVYRGPSCSHHEVLPKHVPPGWAAREFEKTHCPTCRAAHRQKLRERRTR